MLTLALTACLLGDPTRCRDHKITIHDENVGMLTCMMVSHQIIAKWATEHPGFVENWYVKKWACSFETEREA
jgi:hypothetical protein